MAGVADRSSACEVALPAAALERLVAMSGTVAEAMSTAAGETVADTAAGGTVAGTAAGENVAGTAAVETAAETAAGMAVAGTDVTATDTLANAVKVIETAVELPEGAVATKSAAFGPTEATDTVFEARQKIAATVSAVVASKAAAARPMAVEGELAVGIAAAGKAVVAGPAVVSDTAVEAKSSAAASMAAVDTAYGKTLSVAGDRSYLRTPSEDRRTSERKTVGCAEQRLQAGCMTCNPVSFRLPSQAIGLPRSPPLTCYHNC